MKKKNPTSGEKTEPFLSEIPVWEGTSISCKTS